MQAARIHIAFACMMAVVFPGNASGQARNTPAADNGTVFLGSAPQNEIVSLTTKLVVPAKPDKRGTLFLWPGLQPRPGEANFLPIDNGVLQPVLSWGPSCAPGSEPDEYSKYSTWWISAQYVNDYGHYTGYQGCFGGPVMPVNPGDTLLITMSLFRSVWTQTVLDLKSKASVSFHISLQNQAQNFAVFSIEPKNGATSPDVVFSETTIAFARPDVLNCRVEARGPDDVASDPIIIDRGQSCYIEKITLKPPARPAVSNLSCRKEASSKSTDGRSPATITFTNKHGSAISLYWIDYAGRRQPFGTIDDGKSSTLSTYLTNPWVVTDQSGVCLGLYEPSDPPKEIIVR